MVDDTGSCSASVARRLAQAERAFWRDASTQTDKNLSLRERNTHYCNQIAAVAAFSAGAWTWSIGLVKQLRAFELSLLRRINKIRKGQNEDWECYWKRSAKTVRNMYEKGG